MHLPTMPAARSLVASTVVLAAALGACGGGATPAPASAAASLAASPGASAGGSEAGGGTVSIQDFAFNPGSLTTAVGDTVTWTNADSAGHTVTADDGSFDSSTMSGGTTFSQTFATAGSYPYHCAIHSSMKGTIVVQ